MYMYIYIHHDDDDDDDGADDDYYYYYCYYYYNYYHSSSNVSSCIFGFLRPSRPPEPSSMSTSSKSPSLASSPFQAISTVGNSDPVD